MQDQTNLQLKGVARCLGRGSLAERGLPIGRGLPFGAELCLGRAAALAIGLLVALVLAPTTAHAQKATTANSSDAKESSQDPVSDEGGENKGDAETGDGKEEPEEKLPRLEEMELPSAAELLRGPRLDWIVLKHNEEVLVAEPVTPRPETLLKMQETIDKKIEQRRNLSGDALARHRAEVEELKKLHVRLPDQTDEADYLLPMKLIEQIIHHEDLVLRRVDKLTQEKNFDLAFELLNILLRNTPQWPGALERHNALLFAEADREIAGDQFETALAILEEIHSRSPQYAGLSARTGTVIDHLIEQAVAASDWRKARYYRRRLMRLFPDHSSPPRWQSRFIDEAEQQLAAAAKARSQGDHRLALTHAEQAVAIWPALRNLRARFRRFADRYQRLHVGVLDLPSDRDAGAVVKSQAAYRAERLNGIRFFEVDHADDGSAHYSTRFCDRWEPLNLGREVKFELRNSRQPWEAQPVVTAPRIAERIAARLDPSNPAYDERLAGYANSVEVNSPYAFTLRFDRVPVRTEPLLAITVLEAGVTEAAEATDDEASPSTDGEASSATDEETSPVSVAAGKGSVGEFSNVAQAVGGFRRVEQTTDRAVYRRVLSEPEGLRHYHLAEIEEHRYADSDAALQGLIRGEVSMLIRPPAWIVGLLRSDEQMLKAFFVEKMAVPVTHLVQFHPRSQALKNREFRRALAYAINRQKILADTVLRNGADDMGRVVNGPLPSESDGNNAVVRTRRYDPLAAVSLTLAARKQLGGVLPSLKMIVVDDPVAQQAAAQLVESWARFGITVEIVDMPQGPLVTTDDNEAEWDLLYRTAQLTEPVTQLWPFLTLTGRARVSDLDPFPDWLRQEIIALDLASDWRAALQSVNTLHLHLWGEVMLLPLWEIDDYLIYRKHVRGVPVSPVHPYEDVDRWVIESWYAEDQP